MRAFFLTIAVVFFAVFPANAATMRENVIAALTTVYVGATKCDTNFNQSDAVAASKIFIPLAGPGFREKINQTVQAVLTEWENWTEAEQTAFCGSIPDFAEVLQIDTEPWGISDTVELAGAIAAEEFCNLSFNEDAVFEYIVANVPENLADFASDFENSQSYTKNGLGDLSALDKRVRCMQTERLARLWGFLE